MTTQLHDLDRIEDELTQVQHQLTAAATTLDALHSIQTQFADLVQTYAHLQGMLRTIDHDWHEREAAAHLALTRLGDAETSILQLVGDLEATVRAHLAEVVQQMGQLGGAIQQQVETFQHQQTTLAQTLRQDLTAQFAQQHAKINLALSTMDEQVAARLLVVQEQSSALDRQIRQVEGGVQQQVESLQHQQATLAQALRNDLEAQLHQQHANVDRALSTMDEQVAARIQVVQEHLVTLETVQHQERQQAQAREQQVQEQLATLDKRQQSDRELFQRTLEALYRRINEQHAHALTGLRQDLSANLQQRTEQTEQLLVALDGRVLTQQQAVERGVKQHTTDVGQRLDALDQRLLQDEALLGRNRQIVTILMITVMVLAVLLAGLGMWVFFSVKG